MLWGYAKSKRFFNYKQYVSLFIFQTLICMKEYMYHKCKIYINRLIVYSKKN